MKRLIIVVCSGIFLMSCSSGGNESDKKDSSKQSREKIPMYFVSI